MTQLNNSVLWPETLLVNLMANFWWSTWCLVFTLVIHCCLCHVGPQLKRHSAPAPAPAHAGFTIPNPAKFGPNRIWKIISGATIIQTSYRDSWLTVLPQLSIPILSQFRVAVPFPFPFLNYTVFISIPEGFSRENGNPQFPFSMNTSDTYIQREKVTTAMYYNLKAADVAPVVLGFNF